MSIGVFTSKAIRNLFLAMLPLVAFVPLIAGKIQMAHLEQVAAISGWSRDSGLGDFAVIEYVGYAINAPAWVLTHRTQVLSWVGHTALLGTWLTGVDVAYLVTATIMWGIIGVVAASGTAVQRSVRHGALIWVLALARVALAVLGLTLWYDTYLDLYPITIHVDWFHASLLAWGVVLIIAAVYLPSSARRRTWCFLMGSIGLIAGGYTLREGILGYYLWKPLDLDMSFLLPPIIWGAFLISLGLGVFIRAYWRPRQTMENSGHR